MNNELDQIRAFRAEEATVDPDSQAVARAALLAHIAAREKRRSGLRNGVPNRRLHAARLRDWAAASLKAAIVALSVAITLAVVAIALLAGGRQRSQPSAAAHSSRRQQLIALLGVLRRPQTPADLSFDTKFPYNGPQDQEAEDRVWPERALVRLAAVTPWGAKVFIVPLTASKDPLRRRELGETVALWVQGIGWSIPATVGDLKAGGGWGPYSAVRLANGRRVTRFFTVVPDGVAEVKYYYGGPGPWPRPGQALRFGASITAAVHDNVAVIQSDRPRATFGFEVSYAADGHMVGRSRVWNYLKWVGDRYIVKG